MKKFKIFVFAIAFVFLFSGCKKDEDLIVGMWNLSEIYYNGVTSTPSGNVLFRGEGLTYSANITFNKEGTYEISGTYTIRIITTTGSSNTVNEFTYNLNDQLGVNGSWTLENKQLTLTSSNSAKPYNFTLQFLDKKTIKLVFQNVITDNNTTIVSGYFSFKK
ncbi:MAG: hypothetical protein NZM35_03850 [Chitinophagales bacterium]|nr:hypothetical protein [Chitinophagales bacterium]MDW8418730.1 hypothetical protein [Chitinophagales bacterium]